MGFIHLSDWVSINSMFLSFLLAHPYLSQDSKIISKDPTYKSKKARATATRARLLKNKHEDCKSSSNLKERKCNGTFWDVEI